MWRRNRRASTPKFLLLDLFLYQKPGIWPEVLVWKQVRYDIVVHGKAYTDTQIFCGADSVAHIKVDEVH